jgi:hypothetical protein
MVDGWGAGRTGCKRMFLRVANVTLDPIGGAARAEVLAYGHQPDWHSPYRGQKSRTRTSTIRLHRITARLGEDWGREKRLVTGGGLRQYP